MNLHRLLTAAMAAILVVVGTAIDSTTTTASSLRVAQTSSGSCSLTGLRVDVSWQAAGVGLPGGGGLEGTMRFTKKGAGTCTLSGWPRVRIFDAQHHRLNVDQRNLAARTATIPIVVVRSRGTPEREAIVSISWLNWCKGTIKRPLSIGIRLPQRSTFHRFLFTSGGRLVSSCVNPTASSVLDVSPFAPSP